MIDGFHSLAYRLPPTDLDLTSFDRLLQLFEDEYDQLICQADLPSGPVITEDPAAFRDAISEHSEATNIRVRGWSHAAGEPIRLGEVILAEHRAEIRLDGYRPSDGGAAFARTVRDLAVASRRPSGWLHSPWLIPAGLLAGTFVGVGVGRNLGLPNWPGDLVAAAVGATVALAVLIVALRLALSTSPYAGVRGLGLRSAGRLNPKTRTGTPPAVEAAGRRGAA